MDITTIDQLLSQFFKNLTDIISVRDMIVYGSYQGSTATDASDIDVLVVSESFSQMPYEDRTNILFKAAGVTEPEIHPWGVTEEELDKAGKFSVVGQARDEGLHFLRK